MIQPMGNRILVKRVHQNMRITLTDADKTRTAKVLAVGPKVVEVKAGDVVVLPGIASQFPDWEQKDTVLITEADVGLIVG
jgi:co-chaperonin GroES (HSP10)